MAFLSDTFTEASDTALGSHTPDVGGTWTVFSAGGMTVAASEDRVRGDSSSSSGAAYNSASPASDEYDVEAIVRRTTSDSNPLGGIYVRYDTAGPHYVQLYMSQPDSLLVMQEVQSGAVSESSTYSKTWTADLSYTFKIEARNGTNGVKGYLDGTQRVQITWSGGSTPGKAGVRARLYGRVDSIVATDYATGVTADLSGTLGALTLSSDATVANGAGATLTGTLAAVTLSSSAAVANGVGATLAVTLSALVSSSEASVVDGAGGALTVTLDDLVMSSTAVVGTLPVLADLTGTLAALTLSSSAAVANGVGATLTATLGTLTLSSEAAVTSAGDVADGTLSVTLAALTLTSAAEVHGADIALPRTRRIGGATLSPPDDDVIARVPGRRIGSTTLRRAA